MVLLAGALAAPFGAGRADPAWMNEAPCKTEPRPASRHHTRIPPA